MNDETKARLAARANMTSCRASTLPNGDRLRVTQGWLGCKLSTKATEPVTVIPAAASSGTAVDTSEANTVTTTGPVTQINSYAVVSNANNARTVSAGTIRGYRARTTGIIGGIVAPTRVPSAASRS